MLPIVRFFRKVRHATQLTNFARRRRYLHSPHTSFTRRRPPTFPRTVSLILDLARQTLALELARFFDYQPQRTVTKSAFCQRRQLIKPTFFHDFFYRTVQLFYDCFPDHKRWKGKRLLAVDGTGQALPNFEPVGDYFGTHLNQHGARPSTRLLLTHDLLNNIIYRLDYHSQQTAEITEAYQNIAELPTDAVYIYDRHYASFALAYLHDRRGSDYLIRMKTEGGSKLVDNFVQSAERELVAMIKLRPGRAAKKLCDLGLQPATGRTFRVRLVRVELDDGTVEVLMTSLLDRLKYPHHVFKWLYGKRWGVETAIFTLKSFLQLALISSNKPRGVEQDLWASFAFYNQQSALVQACEAEVERRTLHRRYRYQLNRNVTVGIVQHFIYQIYLADEERWRARLQVLLRLLPDYTEAVRPDRHRPRERRVLRMNNRHIHERNYRDATAG